jgi:membrane protease YdiL (CAAX protease family)
LPDTPDLTGNIPAPDDAPAAPTPPVPTRFSSHGIFLGSDGLRAGWSLLLYFALLVALLFGSGFLMSKAGQEPTPGALIMPKLLLESEGVTFLCIAVATWIMAKIEGRPNGVYGLSGRCWAPNFFAGLSWGVALLSLLVVGLRVTGLLVFDARLLFGRSALRYSVVWFGGFLLVGLLEEYLFRGYLQFTVTRGLSAIYGWFHLPRRDELGFWTSAVLLSFGFGFTHRSNAGESPIGLLAAGLIGVVFCLSLWRTGSLWWAIGFHASWDWAQSFLYGVADSGDLVQGHLFATHPVGRPILSGGLTGPEGSILILPIVALTIAVIVLTVPRVHSGHTPEDTRQPQLLHLDLQ